MWATDSSSTTSVSTAVIDGSGSLWSTASNTNVGYSGWGSLTITNGGSLYTGGSGVVGYSGTTSGHGGTVTVDGTGSTWTEGGSLIYVSHYQGKGRGLLNITNGGLVTGNSDTVEVAAASSGAPGNRAD